MNPEARMILFVEDDSKDAELALAALVKYNSASRVEFVRDGEEALDYLLSRGKFKTRSGGSPAVVVVDLKMPKMDGLELVKRIRAEEQLILLPIVVFSSSRAESDLIECYRCGVNAYVVKPLGFQEFMEAVKGLASFWA
ncbi:MAG: response regulator, partial [Verrucomicrobiota bacterium]